MLPKTDASNIAERFWSKVNKTDSCWLWTGAVSCGYGVFRYEGSMTTAHRAAWIITNGPVPTGKEVMHEVCNHSLCVRPEHLAVGTHEQNMQKASRLGNMQRTGRPMLTRTHCINGHELTEDNVYLYQRRYRKCKKCKSFSQSVLKAERIA